MFILSFNLAGHRSPTEGEFMGSNCCSMVTEAEYFAEMNSVGVGSQHSSIYVDSSYWEIMRKSMCFIGSMSQG